MVERTVFLLSVHPKDIARQWSNAITIAFIRLSFTDQRRGRSNYPSPQRCSILLAYKRKQCTDKKEEEIEGTHPASSGTTKALPYQLAELLVGALKHHRQGHSDPTLHHFRVPRLYPLLQAEGEVLREAPQLLQPPAHLLAEILELRLEVVLDAEGEQGGAPPDHTDRLVPREPDALQVLELRDQRVLHAGDQQYRVLVGQGVKVTEAQPLEVKQSRPELVPDAGDQQPRALVDGPPEALVGDAEVPGQEAEDGAEVGLDVGGEELGAHAEDPAQVLLVDALGLEEGDDGVDGVEGGAAEGGVEGEGPARVDAHDLEAEDLLLELEGDVGVGRGVERVLVEEALGELRGQLGCGGGREGRWRWRRRRRRRRLRWWWVWGGATNGRVEWRCYHS